MLAVMASNQPCVSVAPARHALARPRPAVWPAQVPLAPSPVGTEEIGAWRGVHLALGGPLWLARSPLEAAGPCARVAHEVPVSSLPVVAVQSRTLSEAS